MDILFILGLVAILMFAMAVVSEGDPLLAIQVIPFIDVTITPTVPIHVVSCVYNHTNIYSAVFTPGTSDYVNRAVSHMDTSAVLVLLTPATPDPVILALEVARKAGDSVTFTFVEPSGYSTDEVEMFVDKTGDVQVGENRYQQTWNLTPADAPIITTTV